MGFPLAASRRTAVLVTSVLVSRERKGGSRSGATQHYNASLLKVT